MATKTAAIIQSGTSNYLTPAESFNVVATDTLTPGIVGTYTATSGVAPTTGSFAVNAQGSPNMTVAVSAGQAYVSATPTGGTAQNIRVKMTSSENVTIAANSTGSTRYDFVYVKVDADKLNNPAADGTDVVTLTTQRSTTQDADSNGALANALLIAVVTVSNGASSIANSDITDRRLPVNSQTDGWQQANETWTYASATTITVPTGATFKYAVGDKVKLMQSGAWKYFYIVTVADTLLTVTGGSDYTVANATIAAPCFSKRATPVGFPQVFNYTPSNTNITIGTGGGAQNAGTFTITGKTVHFLINIIFGTSGNSMGSNPVVGLPVAVSSNYSITTPSQTALGQFTYNDVSGGVVDGFGWVNVTSGRSAVQLIVNNVSATYPSATGLSSTIPFTWSTSDQIKCSGVYQIA